MMKPRILLTTLLLGFSISPTFAFALSWAGRQVLPPGCKNPYKTTGRFACEGGDIQIVNGYVTVGETRECAFIEPLWDSSVILVEIDNPRAEFTDEYACRRL